MSPEKWALAVLLLQLSSAGCGFCGKVLVWPCDMSHWLNMKVILEKLTEKGHEVTVLTFHILSSFDYKKPSPLKFEVLPVDQKESVENMHDTLLDLILNVFPNLPPWQSTIKLNDFVIETTNTLKIQCEEVVYNQTFMKKLHEANYDVMLIDPVMPCGELIAELLSVPFVLSLRSSVGGTKEKHCGKLPAPRSYVPVQMMALTDRMTFLERVQNTMISVFFDFWIRDYDIHYWDQFYSEALGLQQTKNMVNEGEIGKIIQVMKQDEQGRPTTLCETLGKAEIWLIRTYWDFNFPYPYVPNFEFVGGLHCKPPKPLPEEIENFVQSSGENGIVVFSLGTFVQYIPEEKANLIASALAQIPQKVLWRFKGKKPATLGANTRLYDWLPQNDLLGHPKTKAFITHGGINGIYEAIYHGVPMVGIPMFADQFDNIAHMKVKGAAVELKLNTMTSADLLKALRMVINDPSYKENVMKLSRIHHDQPIKPLDRAVFWIEFVMRHKEAKHLRPASHDLTWFQYHSLDVIGFLLACVGAAIFLITKCCLFFCKKIW